MFLRACQIRHLSRQHLNKKSLNLIVLIPLKSILKPIPTIFTSLACSGITANILALIPENLRPNDKATTSISFISLVSTDLITIICYIRHTKAISDYLQESQNLRNSNY